MAQYKLIDAISVATMLRPLSMTVQYGAKKIVKHDGFMTLVPKELYQTDDPVLTESLKAFTFDQRYNKTLEDALKAAGAEYQIEHCRSCGGRIRKIKYHPVEVIENV